MDGCDESRSDSTRECYIAEVREIVRRHWRYLFFFTTVAVALRLFFIFRYPSISGDSLIYGDIAKNWLTHGIYGLTTGGGVQPTYIRLPGYPALLAFTFKIAGMEHYRAALFAQMLVDTASCYLIAALAWLLAQSREALAEPRGESAALLAFALASLCPFTASYAAAALTETWSFFFTALALVLAGFAIRSQDAKRLWAACGLALGAGIMFRPDNGMLVAIIGGWLLWRFLRGPRRLSALRAGVVVALMVSLFIVPWTVRNWRTMHRLQPLAPRNANDPSEFVAEGFSRWARTWTVDFISVERVLWRVDGEEIDLHQLPDRAFDSAEQRQQTEQLITDYNEELSMTPDLDTRFAALAAERIRARPLRYYLELPLLRMADMWLRPRTEWFEIETDWWNWDDHSEESAVAVALAALNIAFVMAALVGFFRLRREGNALFWMAVVFVLLRTLFLGSMENPEPRYTLEMFPVMIALAGCMVCRPNGVCLRDSKDLGFPKKSVKSV